jgi:Icc-related predicted phosphoesterase
MKICAISDTHGQHRKLNIPECDILIHAGDLTWKGEYSIIKDYDLWTKEMQEKNIIKHSILIAGNHDFSFEKYPSLASSYLEFTKYLQDSSIVVDGIKIYGSPWTPRFYDWAFNADRGEHIKQKWDKIDQSADILVTHGPPFGYGDTTSRGPAGCEELLSAIKKIKPKFHICGHMHQGSGVYKTDFGTTIINAALLDDSYTLTKSPTIFEIG